MFNRNKSPHNQTAAFLRFKAHHTEVNNLYWSFIPADIIAHKMTKSIKDTEETATAFSLSSSDNRRYAPTISEWRTNIKEFENWTRLNCLMAAASYFEIYYKTILKLSILSCPGIILSEKSVIDGAKLLKHNNIQIDAMSTEIVNSCAIGDWNARNSNFSRIFSNNYTEIKNNVGDLERIRNIRNGVGHGFGRDIKTLSYTFDTTGDMHRLAEARLQKYLKLILDIATSLDRFMLVNYIGSYEAIHFFATHIYNRNNHNKETNSQKLKKLFHEQTDIPSLSKNYCDGLVEYYFNL